MQELYNMVDTWASQQYENDEKTKGLEAQKFALQEDIHDQALFRASLRLAIEMTRKAPLDQPA